MYCGSRRELNDTFIAKFSIDTAENEPSKFGLHAACPGSPPGSSKQLFWFCIACVSQIFGIQHLKLQLDMLAEIYRCAQNNIQHFEHLCISALIFRRHFFKKTPRKILECVQLFWLTKMIFLWSKDCAIFANTQCLQRSTKIARKSPLQGVAEASQRCKDVISGQAI